MPDITPTPTPAPAPMPPPGVTPAPNSEAVRDAARQARSIVETIRETARLDYQAELAAEVARLASERPDRRVLESVADAPAVPALGGARIVSPYAHLYARMPAELRAYRSPDADHWSAQWIRGLVRKDRGAMLEAEDQFARLGYGRADLVEGTASGTSGMTSGTGASLLPTPIAGSIVLALTAAARVRQIAQLFTSPGKTLRVPRSAASTAVMVSENTALSQIEPTVDHALLDKKKAAAYFEFSMELLNDAAFSVVSFLTERAGMALGTLEDVQFATSNGTAPNVTGNLTSGVTNVAEALSGTLTYADVVLMYFTLPEPYRAAASWAADGTVLKLLSMIDDAGGRPLFTPANAPPNVVGDTSGNIGSIFGRPVYSVPFSAGTLWFGDARRAYGILTGSTLEVGISDQFLFSSDMMALKVISRFDGNVLLADAARVMTGLTLAG